MGEASSDSHFHSSRTIHCLAIIQLTVKPHITGIPTETNCSQNLFQQNFFSWPFIGWTLSWINSNIWNSAKHTIKGIICPQQFCWKGQTHLLLKWKVTIAKCQMELEKKNFESSVCVLHALASSVCVESCPSVITVLSFFFPALLKVCEDLLIADAQDQFGYFHTRADLRAELQAVFFPLG